MKTNKQRTQEVLNRVELAKKQNLQQDVQTQTNPKCNKNRTLKIASICASLVIVVFVALGITLGLLLGKPNMLNLDKAYIVNFENYSGIGAGALINAENSTESQAITATASTTNPNYLIGVNKDGKPERLRYKKNKDDSGDGEEITYYLTNMCNFEKYTLVEFDTSPRDPSDYRYMSQFFGHNKEQVYLIDNSCGRFYLLSDKFDGITISYNRNAYGSVSELSESNEAIYFLGDKSNYYPKGSTSWGDDKLVICKAYIENDVLIVKEMSEPYQGGLSIEYFVDIYGNIFLGKGSNQYRVNDKGELAKLDETFHRVLNGRAYNSDLTAYLDENGNVVENSTEIPDLFFSKDELLKKEGNTEYYLHVDDYNYSEIIYKIVWSDEEKFSAEKIYDFDRRNLYVTTKDYVYICENLSIYKVEITTGEKSGLPLSEPLFFTSIETDNLGHVVFEALNTLQNKVYGIIDNEGTIKTDVEHSDFKIYYIYPLN